MALLVAGPSLTPRRIQQALVQGHQEAGQPRLVQAHVAGLLHHLLARAAALHQACGAMSDRGQHWACLLAQSATVAGKLTFEGTRADFWHAFHSSLGDIAPGGCGTPAPARALQGLHRSPRHLGIQVLEEAAAAAHKNNNNRVRLSTTSLHFSRDHPSIAGSSLWPFIHVS